MISFTVSLVVLVLGYLVYGRFVAKVFGPDNRPTPAYRLQDGMDYIPMPTWKIFMIQFLNIAGTGPIFGAIMGALYGPSAFLWFIFGCIFAGAVHDYLSGMISIRMNGCSLTEIIGKYLGHTTKKNNGCVHGNASDIGWSSVCEFPCLDFERSYLGRAVHEHVFLDGGDICLLYNCHSFAY